MKVKNIKLTIKDRKTVLKEFAEILAKARRGEKIERHEEISFENIDTLRKVLTEKRMELLHAIKQYAPESVYELAKILKRDLKSVNIDIQVLENLGLINLETKREERKKVRPIVGFNKLNVEIAI
jgi:predicted transcriptional regulator